MNIFLFHLIDPRLILGNYGGGIFKNEELRILTPSSGNKFRNNDKELARSTENLKWLQCLSLYCTTLIYHSNYH